MAPPGIPESMSCPLRRLWAFEAEGLGVDSRGSQPWSPNWLVCSNPDRSNWWVWESMCGEATKRARSPWTIALRMWTARRSE